MHQLGHARDAAGHLVIGQLLHPQAKADVFKHGQVGKDGIVLKHHRDATVLGRQVVDTFPADPDLALTGGFKARNDPQQGRFPAPRCAQQNHEFLIFDGQVDV